MQRGINSYGVYVPNLRLDRAAIAAAHAWAFPALKSQAKGVRAVASWDEDTVTMGVEAARASRCRDVGALSFASTTPPFADLQNATLVASGLGLASQVETSDVGGSMRCGSTALLGALRAGAAGNTLVVAADARMAKPGSVQEMQYGAGAAAFSVGTEGVIAKLLAAASRADSFIDHFRATGEKYDYFWEERWVRDEGYGKIVPAAVKTALDQAGVPASSIAHFCMANSVSGIAATLAKKIGINPEALVEHHGARCGDAGAAQPMIMLATALDRAKPGDRILLVTFGAGCDVLLLEATDALADYRPAQTVNQVMEGGRIESHYTKMLSFHGELQLDWGMRAESSEKIALTQQYRAREQLAHFVAGQCTHCGQVQFPQLASCVNCGEMDKLSPVPLADLTAKLASHTADWLQYYPAPPLYFGLVQFDNGARVMMEVVDVDPARPLDVGTPLRMVYRIKSRDTERHNHRYFWKATPLVAEGV